MPVSEPPTTPPVLASTNRMRRADIGSGCQAAETLWARPLGVKGKSGHDRRLASVRGLPEPVEAPPARASRRDVEEDEAVDDCELALVEDWQQGPRPVAKPVRERHEPAREERAPAREEPDHHEHAAAELDRPGDPGDERGNACRDLPGEAEQLLHPV